MRTSHGITAVAPWGNSWAKYEGGCGGVTETSRKILPYEPPNRRPPKITQPYLDGWEWARHQDCTMPAYWENVNYCAPNQPVVGVSWWEAEAFCRWSGVRLPTADEAEASARGPESSEYPYGENWEPGACNGQEAGLGNTSAVGIFPRDRSPFGIFDVAGNVWEWCEDADVSLRVIRGGCWRRSARLCRAAHRFAFGPESRFDILGFRVAADPPSGPGTSK